MDVWVYNRLDGGMRGWMFGWLNEFLKHEQMIDRTSVQIDVYIRYMYWNDGQIIFCGEYRTQELDVEVESEISYHLM